MQAPIVRNSGPLRPMKNDAYDFENTDHHRLDLPGHRRGDSPPNVIL